MTTSRITVGFPEQQRRRMVRGTIPVLFGLAAAATMWVAPNLAEAWVAPKLAARKILSSRSPALASLPNHDDNSRPTGEPASSPGDDHHGPQPFSYRAEVVVVGSNPDVFGHPMGSFWWQLYHRRNETDATVSAAIAVPEGIAPGSLTPPGAPIYILAASNDGDDEPSLSLTTQWLEDRVPPDRHRDCVVVLGGMDHTVRAGILPAPPIEDTMATYVLPKFEVVFDDEAEPKQLPRDDETLGTTSSSSSSWAPPKHLAADTTLRWHPVLCGKHASRIASLLQAQGVATKIVDDLGWIMEQTITTTTSARGQNRQAQIFTKEGDSNTRSPPKPTRTEKLVLDRIRLVAWGQKRHRPETTTTTSNQPPPQHISIVGGGMMGSALALSLAQQCCDSGTTIVVLDEEEETDTSSAAVGRTTPASWAWINANSKAPKSYQLLNQLGIHAWKHHEHLSSLPEWRGSLVRFETIPAFVTEGGYPAEGPLTLERIRELEPYANWELGEDGSNSSGSNTNTEGYTYYFPDEACVDPSEAVRALRNAAETLGVEFRGGVRVHNVVRDPPTQAIAGLNATRAGRRDSEVLPTDLVVSAAGTGVAQAGLGGIPLLDRPGQIVYARPSSISTASSSTTPPRLSKILVDPLRSSHLLQRKDGTLVAGGGALEVGGSGGTVQVSSSESSSQESSEKGDQSSLLLEGARQLSPSLVGSATVSHTSRAVRPMPRDGLPVVGYVEQGLYVAVTHSGITLGPLLAALAAGEIVETIDCDLLAPYRPSRFANPS